MGLIRRALAASVLSLVMTGCGVFGGGAPAAPTGEPANDVLARGLAAHSAGRVEEAIVLYYQALAKDPNSSFAFFNLGEIAHRRGQLVAAEAWYRLALENDKVMPQALYNLAIVRQVRGDSTESAALLRRLIQTQPNNAAAHWNLGLALRSLGQTAEANVEFATAQRLDPKLVPPTGTPQPTPTR